MADNLNSMFGAQINQENLKNHEDCFRFANLTRFLHENEDLLDVIKSDLRWQAIK